MKQISIKYLVIIIFIQNCPAQYNYVYQNQGAPYENYQVNNPIMDTGSPYHNRIYHISEIQNQQALPINYRRNDDCNGIGRSPTGQIVCFVQPQVLPQPDGRVMVVPYPVPIYIYPIDDTETSKRDIIIKNLKLKESQRNVTDEPITQESKMTTLTTRKSKEKTLTTQKSEESKPATQKFKIRYRKTTNYLEYYKTQKSITPKLKTQEIPTVSTKKIRKSITPKLNPQEILTVSTKKIRKSITPNLKTQEILTVSTKKIKLDKQKIRTSAINITGITVIQTTVTDSFFDILNFSIVKQHNIITPKKCPLLSNKCRKKTTAFDILQKLIDFDKPQKTTDFNVDEKTSNFNIYKKTMDFDMFKQSMDSGIFKKTTDFELDRLVVPISNELDNILRFRRTVGYPRKMSTRKYGRNFSRPDDSARRKQELKEFLKNDVEAF